MTGKIEYGPEEAATKSTRITTVIGVFILWHVDPLLGNDHERSSYITAIAK
jgi:hypothetical protein